MTPEEVTEEIYQEHLNSPLYKELGITPPTREEVARNVQRYVAMKADAIRNVQKFQRDNR